MFSPKDTVASRKRTMVKAANKSPVPLKKQLIEGTSIWNRRGAPFEYLEEPITEMVGEDLLKRTEVTTTCGI